MTTNLDSYRSYWGRYWIMSILVPLPDSRWDSLANELPAYPEVIAAFTRAPSSRFSSVATLPMEVGPPLAFV